MILKKLLFSSFTLIVILSGCGPKETSGGAAGTASGAIVGEAVSGRKNKGTGTLLGAAIGNYIGRKIGRAEDRIDSIALRQASADAKAMADKQGDRAQDDRQEVQELKAENRYLRKNLKKWCDNCQRKVSIAGANNCPYCGTTLIKEKFCKICATTFSPESNYRYCPYCSKENVRLSYR